MKSRLEKKKKDPYSYNKTQITKIEYWLEKGYTEEEAKKKISERQSTFSKEKCIKKYGEEEGTKRWKERQDKWQKTLNNKSPEEIEEINKKKNCLNIETFIEKYGKKEGTKRWKEACKKRSTGLPFFIKKYGEEDGYKKYKERNAKIVSNRKNCQYSQESLNIFIPLYEWLVERGYSQTDIFIGCNETGEFKLYESRKNKKLLYFYDFAIPKKRIMIEYNGEKFHPNPSMGKENWCNWKTPYGKTADEIYEYDFGKIECAKKSGYRILEIWSSKTISENISICKEFIIKNESNL